AYAVRAQRTLINLLCFLVEFGDIERAAGNAILAADAICLIEVDDAIRVLHNGAVGRAGDETSRLFAVHALVFAHEPLQVAVLVLSFLELDQVPEIPCRLRHGLVGVLKQRLAELITVPLQAGDLAGLAADASGGIHQFANVIITGNASTRRSAAM